MDKEQLIRSIHNVFREISKPTSSQLFIGGWETYDKFHEALQDFTSTNWQDISFATIRKYGDGILGGLNPEWFCYLLPTFLIRVLENLSEADILINTTRYNLTHPVLVGDFDQNSEQRFRAIVSLLNSEQCSEISQYLRYFITLDPDAAIYNDNNIVGAIQFWDAKRREK